MSSPGNPMVPVNPARAGMILMDWGEMTVSWRKPRASGDDPFVGYMEWANVE